jgi:hypothetical protein
MRKVGSDGYVYDQDYTGQWSRVYTEWGTAERATNTNGSPRIRSEMGIPVRVSAGERMGHVSVNGVDLFEMAPSIEYGVADNGHSYSDSSAPTSPWRIAFWVVAAFLFLAALTVVSRLVGWDVIFGVLVAFWVLCTIFLLYGVADMLGFS